MRRVWIIRRDPRTGRVAGCRMEVEDGISNEEILAEHRRQGVEVMITEVFPPPKAEYRPDPWGEYDPERNGYTNSETHVFSPGPDRPAKKLPPRGTGGRFIS